MIKYLLKDKDQYKALVKALDNFEKSFNRHCSEQYDDGSSYVVVENLYNSDWRINIPKDQIEITEELKPYIWYARDKFDENPKGYFLVEEDSDECLTITRQTNKELWSDTKRFMYVEKE